MRIDFWTIFPIWYKICVRFVFRTWLIRLDIFCKAPRDMRKFPQKCQKIAGCWESTVYGSRPPIASKPDSSPPERPGLDNSTSQPWSQATCPCTTSASAYLRFVTIFVRKDKTKYKKRWDGGKLRQTMVDSFRSGGSEPGFEAIRGQEP